MSKTNVSLRIPQHLLDEIKQIEEEHDISRSEATRQVLRHGVDGVRGASAGEQLGQQATAVAGVGTIVAALAALLGDPTGAGLVVPFATTTFLFAMVWASVRAFDGRDLV